MKKIILGFFLLIIAFIFSNAIGIKTYAQTQAALATVNGGGMEYQVARTIATAPDLGTPFALGGILLIVWGLNQRAFSKPKPTPTPVDDTTTPS
jgi:hypothetical protein